MIIQEFSFPEDQLHYFVGLGSISTTELELEDFFNLIELIQNKFKDMILQFFNKRLILNNNHIFYAIYHTIKSFHLKTNISNKQGIEILLYLAANRQIKRAIENFGIDKHQINQGSIDFCIVSMNRNLEIIFSEILNQIKAKETILDLGRLSYKKYETIRKYFGINENQINTILKANGVILDNILPNENNIESLYLALEDLICEKMALLSLERNSSD